MTLGQAIMITQIYKDQLTMVTLAVDPARQPNFFTDIGLG